MHKTGVRREEKPHQPRRVRSQDRQLLLRGARLEPELATQESRPCGRWQRVRETPHLGGKQRVEGNPYFGAVARRYDAVRLLYFRPDLQAMPTPGCLASDAGFMRLAHPS